MLLINFFLLLIVGIFFLLVFFKMSLNRFKVISLVLSGFLFINSCFFLSFFDKLNFNYQLKFSSLFVDSLFLEDSLFLDNFFIFGVDGISIFFFFLTSLLIFFCIIYIWNDNYFKSYALLLFVTQFILFVIFSTLNLFVFYTFFELILVPLFFMIGFWGSREKKLRASLLLVFYTILSSLFFLISIIYIYLKIGSFDFEQIMLTKFSFNEQLFLWFTFFFCFASKIPMFPIHIWLPEAHVEAPTVGSVLLAGILLKLGVYGFIRCNLSFFPEVSIFLSPIIFVFSIFGIIFSALIAIKQTDLKRIIAYSSISHMNLVVIGVFSGNLISIQASIFQSISHGFVASALFFLIGILYSRYHSKLLFYYGGLVNLMPIFSIFMCFFTLSNIALPGTSNFIGEFLLLNGIFHVSFLICILAGSGVIFSSIYSLWLCNRIIFGQIKTNFIREFSDLNMREIFILINLFFLSLSMGIFPNYYFKFFYCSVLKVFINSFF
jgi:proton-translocating NADH-quinone oxidoreductase chain M